MMKRKYLNVGLIFAINIFGVFKKIKSNKRHYIVLIISVITISVFVSQIRHSQKRMRNKKTTFLDILHTLPINQRRYFVWQRALTVLSNQTNSIGYQIESTTNNNTINQVVNDTITKYKVRKHTQVFTNDYKKL